MFASPSTVERVVKVAKQNSFIEKIILFPGAHSSDNNCVTKMIDFIRRNSSALDPNILCKPQRVSRKVAVILYSSGTTGLPKGVDLTEQNLMYSIAQGLYA